jgi:pre-rRNA-processing protein TSR4
MFGDSLFGSKPTGGGAFGGNPFSSTPASTSANPFSTASSTATPFSTSELAAKPPQKPDNPTTNLPQTFASALSLNAPTPVPAPPAEPWPADSELPAPYPLFYLADADYETLDKDEPEPAQKHQILEMDEEPSSGSSGQKEEKDVYESTIDNTFQKFADRLSQNPEQVIRYEFKGSPLLYTKGDAVGRLLGGQGGNAKVTVGGKMPGCANCGAGRCFEVQLTPHAITELESEEVSLEGMEWGTVIVGVCERDCQARGVEVGGVGYVEEWAGVQWEEVADKMKS